MTQNVKIVSADIFIEDHGVLTWMLTLEWDNGVVGFGGTRLNANIIESVLRTVGVQSWANLVGQPVRLDQHDKRLTHWCDDAKRIELCERSGVLK